MTALYQRYGFQLVLTGRVNVSNYLSPEGCKLRQVSVLADYCFIVLPSVSYMISSFCGNGNDAQGDHLLIFTSLQTHHAILGIAFRSQCKYWVMLLRLYDEDILTVPSKAG